MEDEDGGGGARAPWTASDVSALIAAVRQMLLCGPTQVPWEHVWRQLRHALPGRTLTATRQQYWKIMHGRHEALAEEGEDDAAGGSKLPWSQAERAAVAAAARAGLASAELLTVSWTFVESLGAPGLAGRSRAALSRYWGNTLSQTPAARAMLREVSEELAARQQQAAPPQQQVAPQQQLAAPQQQLLLLLHAPFRMLHSLRSAGAIDEQTLRLCWRATAEAMR